MPGKYLRRRCNRCKNVGDVPKTREDFRRRDIVYWTLSPYYEEIEEVEWYAWWCPDCLEEDANDI